ncbi:hypothetical protein B0H13DRAFT_2665101 [Mycena leptocephala]|nr:hypothetical protein B0H13DRAFT_2665101 [Mycena leptocephala]
MQEHPHTPDVLPAHTRTQTHSTTGMRPRLKQQEAIVAHPRRDAATRTSAVPHLPPRFFRLIRPRLAGAWCAPSASRRLPQGTVYSTTTPRAISHATTNPLHAARNRPRRRTTPTRWTPRQRAPQPRPTPPAARAAHGARIPRPPRRLRHVPALRDRLDQCTALTAQPPRLPRSSGPPATPPASAARATVVPHRWRRLRRLFIRHHHLLSSPLDARGWAHPQHNTDISSTCGSLSPPRTPRSSAPPAPWPSSAPSHPRSKPDPGTHHEHDAHALHAVTVFSAAPPSARSQPILSAIHRPTPALPVYSTKTSATPARGAACADGVDPQRYDAPAKSAQAHGDDA